MKPDKLCLICGKQYKYNKNNVCSTCRVWYQRYLKKHKAISYLGGKCKYCGITDYKVLTFHHFNPDNKTFELCDNWFLAWEQLVNELNKCELLCSNCHLKHHISEREIAHQKILEYYKQASVVERQTQGA